MWLAGRRHERRFPGTFRFPARRVAGRDRPVRDRIAELRSAVRDRRLRSAARKDGPSRVAVNQAQARVDADRPRLCSRDAPRRRSRLYDSSGERRACCCRRTRSVADLGEFVRAGFADKYGHFIVGWLAALFLREFVNRCVPLCAPLAVPFQQLVRYPTDFKTEIPTSGIAASLNLVSQAAHLMCQSVPVDLC